MPPWRPPTRLRRPPRARTSTAPTSTSTPDACPPAHPAANDSSEDAVAALQGTKLAFKQFQDKYPLITELEWLRTDGATAFAGVEYTVGIAVLDPSEGPIVKAQTIGEAGTNKDSIDASFAVKGQAVDRLASSGKHDVNSEMKLAKVLEIANGDSASSAVVLFTANRTIR